MGIYGPRMSTTSKSSSAPGLAPRAVKINEAASLLSVTPITIRRLIERGFLKPCRVLRHPLIPIEQIEELLRTR